MSQHTQGTSGPYAPEGNGHVLAAWRGADPAERAPRVWYSPYSRIEIDGTSYRPVSDNAYCHVMEPIDEKGVGKGFHEMFEHQELHALGDKVVEHVDEFAPAAAILRSIVPSLRVRDLPNKRLQTVLMRQFFCDALLREEEKGTSTRSDASMKEAITRIYSSYCVQETARQTADGRCGSEVRLLRPPSPTAARKWLNRYEAYSYEVMALCPRYGRSGNRTPRFKTPERKILSEVAATYASRLKPTKK